MCDNKSNDNCINEFLGLFTKGLSFGYTVIEQFLLIEVPGIETRDLLNQGKLIMNQEWQPDSRYYGLQTEETFSYTHLKKIGQNYSNVFFSPFIYRVCKRNQQNSLNLTAFYVDLDHCSIDEAQVRLMRLPEFLQEPTTIIRSGAGVHIYWILGIKPTVSKLLWMWKKTMQRICELLNGDSQVIEHARLMRLPGTWNTKSKAMCQFITFKPERLFDLFEVAIGLGVIDGSYDGKRAKKNARKKSVKSKKMYEKKEPRYLSNGYSQSLKEEIIELFKLRARQGRDLGNRNNALFTLKQLRATDETLDHVNQTIFSVPLSESEVNYIKRYKMDTEDQLAFPNRLNVVRKLDVTSSEQRLFRYLAEEDVYETTKAVKLIMQRRMNSTRGYLERLLKQKYAKKDGSLKVLAKELHLTSKTVGKYRNSRNTSEAYHQLDERMKELLVEVNEASKYLPSLNKSTDNQSLVDSVYKLQELQKRLQAIVTQCKEFQKKRLNNKEFRDLLKLIRKLEELRNECTFTL